MLLTGPPDYICACLDTLREGLSPTASFLFRPETVTRLAVREVHRPLSAEICVSTDPVTDIEDCSYGEIGRIGNLVDDRDGSGTCVMLCLHTAQLKDMALHRHVADVAVAILRGQRTDMMLAPLHDLMARVRGPRRSCVSVYATTDRGITWQIKDVTSVIDDFLIGEDDWVTVRQGQSVQRVTVSDLLNAVAFSGTLGADSPRYSVPEDAVLVRFKPPGVTEPVIAFYDTFTGLTTVIDGHGQASEYASDERCLLLDCRMRELAPHPYVGILRSGNRFFGAPMGADHVYRV